MWLAQIKNEIAYLEVRILKTVLHSFSEYFLVFNRLASAHCSGEIATYVPVKVTVKKVYEVLYH